MRFFVSADEIGNIKEVVCSRGTDTSKKGGQQPELVQNILQKDEHTNVKNRIVHLKTFSEKWLLATRLGGFLSVYDFFGSSQVPAENYAMLHTYKFEVDDKDRPVSMEVFEEHDFAMVAFESAKVFVVYFNGGKFDVPPLLMQLPPRQTEKPTTLSAFVAHPDAPGIFAYGGKNNDLQIVRLFESNRTFTAADFSAGAWKVKKMFLALNVENDHLDLEVPIWITNILFLQGESKRKFNLVTSTRYGHIRRYETAKDREPTESYKVCEKPIISMVFASEKQDEIIISDTHAFVAKFSLTEIHKKAHRIVSASAGTFYRPSLKLLGKYAEGGNTGAIYGVDASLSADLVVFGGLDRYLRVFELKSRKLVSKVYLGTQISAVKMIDDSDGDKDAEKKAEDEDEELWNELEDGKETANSAPVLKKRKRNI